MDMGGVGPEEYCDMVERLGSDVLPLIEASAAAQPPLAVAVNS
jgi:hypothetical protein